MLRLYRFLILFLAIPAISLAENAEEWTLKALLDEADGWQARIQWRDFYVSLRLEDDRDTRWWFRLDHPEPVGIDSNHFQTNPGLQFGTGLFGSEPANAYDHDFLNKLADSDMLDQANPEAIASFDRLAFFDEYDTEILTIPASVCGGCARPDAYTGAVTIRVPLSDEQIQILRHSTYAKFYYYKVKSKLEWDGGKTSFTVDLVEEDGDLPDAIDHLLRIADDPSQAPEKDQRGFFDSLDDQYDDTPDATPITAANGVAHPPEDGIYTLHPGTFALCETSDWVSHFQSSIELQLGADGQKDRHSKLAELATANECNILTTYDQITVSAIDHDGDSVAIASGTLEGWVFREILATAN
ncbi:MULTISPECIES: hypothetical protein [unclassified Ruegeria]|uniref:hypothetical protein n=1 Tax=unclassified Ruegeria TaxID=2625375 RepID=UPI001489F095|nr:MULTISPECIES: hypothetical protein [unclassified Ruegeria]NOD46296.1 hypothetical protein [Ruegeria sp. HKCCD5849]NOD50404.1 hypothetical protein [Ruegeria sp. HKCCD5851]NOD67220.1 hypothetical protein [Ruegeria sp. HKCCD7303]NOE32809.1 hypothetical protein [Ruegeria sp. HKCCD7318]